MKKSKMLYLLTLVCLGGTCRGQKPEDRMANLESELSRVLSQNNLLMQGYDHLVSLIAHSKQPLYSNDSSQSSQEMNSRLDQQDQQISKFIALVGEELTNLRENERKSFDRDILQTKTLLANKINNLQKKVESLGDGLKDVAQIKENIQKFNQNQDRFIATTKEELTKKISFLDGLKERVEVLVKSGRESSKINLEKTLSLLNEIFSKLEALEEKIGVLENKQPEPPQTNTVINEKLEGLQEKIKDLELKQQEKETQSKNTGPSLEDELAELNEVEKKNERPQAQSQPVSWAQWLRQVPQKISGYWTKS